MDELIAFVRARLDEDERIARDVEPLTYVAIMGGQSYPERFAIQRSVPADDGSYYRQSDPAALRHFLRHDPARVLADVAAKRKLLREIWDGLADLAANITEIRGDDCGVLEYRADLLKLFASPYSDHPSYREAWRP